MSFSVTGPFGPHNQHMGAPRGRARHAVTKLRIVAKPSLIGPHAGSASPNAGARDALAKVPAMRSLAPASPRPPASDLAPTSPSPKVARNLGTLTFLSTPENVAIPTIRFQNLK